MEKEQLKELISEGLSTRELAYKLNTCQSNIKYWLKKYNLKTLFNQYNKGYHQEITEKVCPVCNQTKPVNEFYPRRGRIGYAGYCKKCDNEYTQKRIVNTKIKMILYKGGHCVDCDLPLEKSHYSVFDFHHTNHSEKDPNFKHIRSHNWERIKKEIDKCILLCSNCHRLRHALGNTED
jgi:transposase